MSIFEQSWEAIQVGANGGDGRITFLAGEQKSLDVALTPLVSCFPVSIPVTAVYSLNIIADGRTDEDWNEIFHAASADERVTPSNPRLGAQLPVPYAAWRIWRNVAHFNIPLGTYVNPLYPPIMRGMGVYSAHPIAGIIKDASTLPGTVADYGAMLALPPETVIGSFSIPAAFDQDHVWYAYFNEAGADLINRSAGGVIKLAFYTTDKPEEPYEQLYCINWSSTDRISTLEISCPPEPYHFTPSPGIGGDSVDGTVIRRVQDQLWDDLRLGAGTDAPVSGFLELRFSADNSVPLDEDHRWDELSRVIMTFPTQTASPATIVSAKIRLYCLSAFRQIYNAISIALYEASPISNNSLSPGDYQNVGNIPCSNPTPFASIPTSTFFEIPLNEYGIQQINLGGNTAFALREATYDVGGIEPPSRLGENFLIFASADYPMVGLRPTLIIELG